MTERTVRFGEFQLDKHTLELSQSGAPVKLQQQPARVLAILVDHAGDLVTREELRKQIWSDDTFVDFDRGLNYCVSQIRTALGDTAESPRYLETLRGRGYRFVGAIAQPAQRGPQRRWLLFGAIALLILGTAAVERFANAHAAAKAQPGAIGVAPLVATPGDQQWAAAMHTQIVSHLSMAARVPVVDVARNPRWRVEGRVDHSAQEIRLTMLLRDTSKGSVVWSDVFAGASSDWVDAQSEMAERMTEIIRYRVEGPAAALPMKRSKLPSRVRLGLFFRSSK